MRTVLVSPSPEWLEDRRRRGVDHLDEVWDGVLHVPPDPTSYHQGILGDLYAHLRPIAADRGLATFITLSILDPAGHDRNYRTPDLLVVDPRNVIRRGTEGPVELAIEVLSPHDESREKMPFYAKRGVKELWLVEPETRAFEIYVLRGDAYLGVLPEPNGVVRTPALGLEVSLVEGPKLRIAWSSSSVEI